MPDGPANKERPSAAAASEELSVPRIFQLPDVLIQQVLRHLTLQECVGRVLPAVSRPDGRGGWETVVKNPQYWQPLVEEHFPHHYPASLVMNPASWVAEYKRLVMKLMGRWKRATGRC